MQWTQTKMKKKNLCRRLLQITNFSQRNGTRTKNHVNVDILRLHIHLNGNFFCFHSNANPTLHVGIYVGRSNSKNKFNSWNALNRNTKIVMNNKNGKWKVATEKPVVVVMWSFEFHIGRENGKASRVSHYSLFRCSLVYYFFCWCVMQCIYTFFSFICCFFFPFRQGTAWRYCVWIVYLVFFLRVFFIYFFMSPLSSKIFLLRRWWKDAVSSTFHELLFVCFRFCWGEKKCFFSVLSSMDSDSYNRMEYCHISGRKIIMVKRVHLLHHNSKRQW